MLNLTIVNNKLEFVFDKPVFQIDTDIFMFNDDAQVGSKLYQNKVWENNGTMSFHIDLKNPIAMVVVNINEINYEESDIVQVVKVNNSNLDFNTGCFLQNLFKSKLEFNNTNSSTTLDTKTENIYAEIIRKNGVTTNI